jgi:hypothetical protein
MSKEKEAIEAKNTAIDTARLLGASGDEPDGCKKKYCEKTCNYCEFVESETVAHPGGHYSATAESYWCDLGHWEDDF